MDSNNATILALSLGIPCATLLSIACLLTLRISHRQLLACRIRNPTVPTNSPAPPSLPPVDPYYGIPLEQRPPRILAPLPRRPIPLDEYNRNARSEEDGNSSSTHSAIPPPRPPAPPHRREPVITLSSTVTTEDPPSTPRPPSPGEHAYRRNNKRRFDMGRDIPVTAPPTHDGTWDANPTAPSAPIGSSELWDNVRNRPATTWEPALKPVQNEEPVASGSTLPVPNDSSYWSNVHRSARARTLTPTTPKTLGTNRPTAYSRATTSTGVTRAP